MSGKLKISSTRLFNHFILNEHSVCYISFKLLKNKLSTPTSLWEPNYTGDDNRHLIYDKFETSSKNCI